MCRGSETICFVLMLAADSCLPNLIFLDSDELVLPLIGGFELDLLVSDTVSSLGLTSDDWMTLALHLADFLLLYLRIMME